MSISIKYDTSEKMFVVTGDSRDTFAAKDKIKEVGFRWDSPQKKWWTKDINVAMKLISYCDPIARKMIEEELIRQQNNIISSRQNNADVHIPRPEGLEYLPFQKAGIHYASNKESVLIADDMGLGKTVQAVGILNYKGIFTNVLIICPATLKINWKREVEKWIIKPVRVCIVKDTWEPDADIYIINYDILTKYHEEIHDREWAVLVCDESHSLKNNKAQRTREVIGGFEKYTELLDDGQTIQRKRLMPKIKANIKLFLTGTPILNRPNELWTTLHYLAPNLFKDWKKFVTRYCAAKETRFGLDYKGASNLEELQQILRANLMIRRLKSEVLTELPAKRRQLIEIPSEGFQSIIELEKQIGLLGHIDAIAQTMAQKAMEAKEVKEGEDYKSHFSNNIGDKAADNTSSNETDIDFSNLARVRKEMGVKKIPLVIQHLEDMFESEDKIVLFAHHREVIDTIFDKMKTYNPVKLYGQMSDNDKQSAVDTFQNNPNCRLFIGGIKAAGVGITLTAASTVIFAELDWTPGWVEQCEDRCHRISQQNQVLVQHLVVENSFDAKLAKMLIEKQDISDRALNKRIEVVKHEAIVERVDTLPEARSRALEILDRVKPISLSTPAPRPVVEQVFTCDEINDLLVALRIVANMDIDHAREQNGMGFNKFDTFLGCSFAKQDFLSQKQALTAKQMLRKYKAQIPADLYAAIYKESKEE